MSATTGSYKNKPSKNKVPDDWDDDDDEDEGENADSKDSKEIWAEANQESASKNMPIITTRNGGTSHASFVPPAEAFNKPKRILQRQPPSSNSVLSEGNSAQNSGLSTPHDREARNNSLAERERVYFDVRDRIFGNSRSSSSDSPAKSNGDSKE